MNRLWKAAGIALSASCFVVFQASAKADILVFQFDQVCTGDTPGGTPPWAFLTISDAAPDIVGITLTHSPTSAEGQFLTELDLSLTSIPGDVMAMEPYDPLVTDVEIGENFFTDAGYQFERPHFVRERSTTGLFSARYVRNDVHYGYRANRGILYDHHRGRQRGLGDAPSPRNRGRRLVQTV
jgi:hypothetical protein